MVKLVYKNSGDQYGNIFSQIENGRVFRLRICFSVITCFVHWSL